MPFVPRGKTIPMGKRGQIIALSSLTGVRRMTLSQISANSQVNLTTCRNIINEARRRSQENGIADLCADENILPKPNSNRGCNVVVTAEQKQAFINLTLSDYTHCRMSYAELARAAGLDISIQTVRKIFPEDGIHRRKPTGKPFLKDENKATRLEFCHRYRDQDWRVVIFTDESYFETGELRRSRAKGVLRRAGEAYIAWNINRKFGTGATIMFWGAILYDHIGNQLPYYLYKTPYETAEERRRADLQLQEEYEQELGEEAFHLANGDWLAQDPELKVRKKD